MKTTTKLLIGTAVLLVGAAALAAGAAGGLFPIRGYLRVTANHGDTITCATGQTQGGSICAATDIEANDDLDVADDATIGDDLTVTDDMSADAATFTGTLTATGLIAQDRPWFSVTFNEGAAKGVALVSQLQAAYSTTADAVNLLSYGQTFRGYFVTNTTATGTITPAGTATGLDLNAGSPGSNDEWTFSTGTGMASGGMIIPGTTPAWAACATINVTTVAEAAGLFLEVTTPGAHVDLSSADPNYTSYAAIGIEQTDIVVSDNTDGAVDTTVNAADGVSVALCIRGSAAGVITYYIDGTNTAAAATHTLGDGVPHIVRIQGLNHTGTEAPMNVVSFSLLPQ